MLPIMKPLLYTTALLAAPSIDSVSVLKGTASTGCGTPHTKIDTLRSVTLPNTNRKFAVYLPVDYDEHKQTPLILSYHGRTKTMYNQALISRFNDSTINPSHIAVFPQGLPGPDGQTAWEGAPYAALGVSDLQFTTDLIAWMNDNYCIDNTRIYATGKSNGGGFCDTLACSKEHGGQIAAFAMNSAALYTESDGSVCDPANLQTPIMEFHGTSDGTIHYNGGVSHDASYPNIDDWLSMWSRRNRCPVSTPPFKQDQYHGVVHYTRYDCDGAEGIVQGYKVDGQKHWWISKEQNVENGDKVAPIEASTIMMDFFKQHSLST